MPILKKTVAAVILAFPVAAMAQSTQELKSEIDALKAKLQQLERLIEKQSAAAAAAPAPAADAVDPAEFNRIRVKVESMEDLQESSGFKGLKVSGFIDPTYIYNRAVGKGSVAFLHNNYSSDPAGAVNDFTQDTFGYDNSYFGGVTLKIEKEFEGGVKAMVTLRPRRTVSNTYDFGNIIEEALVTVPFNGLAWRAIAGQVVSWNGYEYVQSNLKKNITSNLLLDFAGPGFVTGAGVEYLQGKWWARAMAGNLNVTHDKQGGRNQGAHWRLDYAKGEFLGWGASGMHGKLFNQRFNYLEADAYFVRGDVTMMGQVEVGRARNSAFNGADSQHWGVSVLGAYKFIPTVEGIIRADYMDNHKNGGGTPAVTFGSVCQPDLGTDPTGATPFEACGDYRNGFGPGAVFDHSAGIWTLGNPNRGAKRSALTLGLNWQYHTNGLLKTELRYDRSDLNSFYYWHDDNYKKHNLTFGVQTVVSF